MTSSRQHRIMPRTRNESDNQLLTLKKITNYNVAQCCKLVRENYEITSFNSKQGRENKERWNKEVTLKGARQRKDQPHLAQADVAIFNAELHLTTSHGVYHRPKETK